MYETKYKKKKGLNLRQNQMKRAIDKWIWYIKLNTIMVRNGVQCSVHEK